MNYPNLAPIKKERRVRACRRLVMAIIAGLAAVCLVSGCAGPEPPRRTSQQQPYQQFGKWYSPMADSADFTETGIASWYGNKFHGNPTASGEIYNMYDMTAAHKTLPLGTRVRVTNLENNRSIVVRVNDRGPFVDNRVIDLSYLAASKIGIAQTGLGRVRITALDKNDKQSQTSRPDLAEAAMPPDADQPHYTLQMGSFTSRENAVNLREALSSKYQPARIVIFHDNDQTFYRVRLGRYSSREEGERARQKMLTEGFTNVKVLTAE